MNNSNNKKLARFAVIAALLLSNFASSGVHATGVVSSNGSRFSEQEVNTVVRRQLRQHLASGKTVDEFHPRALGEAIFKEMKEQEAAAAAKTKNEAQESSRIK